MLAALGSRVGRPGGLPPKPHCSPWADRERLLARAEKWSWGAEAECEGCHGEVRSCLGFIGTALIRSPGLSDLPRFCQE